MAGAALPRSGPAWMGREGEKMGWKFGQTDSLCGAMAEEKKNLIFFFFVVAVGMKGNSRM